MKQPRVRERKGGRERERENRDVNMLQSTVPVQITRVYAKDTYSKLIAHGQSHYFRLCQTVRFGRRNRKCSRRNHQAGVCKSLCARRQARSKELDRVGLYLFTLHIRYIIYKSSYQDGSSTIGLYYLLTIEHTWKGCHHHHHHALVSVSDEGTLLKMAVSSASNPAGSPSTTCTFTTSSGDKT